MRSTKGNNEIFLQIQVSFRNIWENPFPLFAIIGVDVILCLRDNRILFCLLGVNSSSRLKPNNSICIAIIFQLKSLKDTLLASYASQCPQGTSALPVTVMTLLQYLPNAMGLEHFQELSSISTKGQKLCRTDVNSQD